MCDILQKGEDKVKGRTKNNIYNMNNNITPIILNGNLSQISQNLEPLVFAQNINTINTNAQYLVTSVPAISYSNSHPILPTQHPLHQSPSTIYVPSTTLSQCVIPNQLQTSLIRSAQQKSHFNHLQHQNHIHQSQQNISSQQIIVVSSPNLFSPCFNAIQSNQMMHSTKLAQHRLHLYILY